MEVLETSHGDLTTEISELTDARQKLEEKLEAVQNKMKDLHVSLKVENTEIKELKEQILVRKRTSFLFVPR